MKTHELPATPETVHYGYFDYKTKFVLKVKSGDRVIVRTISAHSDYLPENPERIPDGIDDILRIVRKGAGPHILSGPIEVEGAEPGDVLEVFIEDISLACDWGYNLIRSMGGAIPEDFPYNAGRVIDLELSSMTAEIAPGWKVPLQPFFGQIAVCPPEELGEIPSNPPYFHGGNLDNKEIVVGSRVYLPIWKRGAGFSVGDGHASQGDGEVNQTAIETSMDGIFRLTVRKNMSLKLPRAETPTHWITMGFHPDLEDAMKMALREMIGFLSNDHGLTREDAYVFCTCAVDFRITQVVNGHKGVHAMVEKSLLPN